MQESEFYGAVGGSLIGLSVVLNRVVSHMHTGVGSVLKGALLVKEPDSATKMHFLAGLVLAGFLHYLVLTPGAPIIAWQSNDALRSGALVGFGVSMANGCTAGHGISGLSTGSVRSLAAVVTFMLSAITTAVGNEAEAAPTLLEDKTTLAKICVLSLVAVAVFKGMPASSGFLFGTGLVVSGMIDPHIVMSFLKRPFARPFRLHATMGSAVVVAALFSNVNFSSGSQAAIGRTRASYIDWRLIVGSMLFGIGWGTSGVCPGPGVVLAASTNAEAALKYVPSLLIGMQAELWSRRFRFGPLLRRGQYECHRIYDAPTGSCSYVVVDTKHHKMVVIDPVMSDRVCYPSHSFARGLVLFDECFGTDLKRAVHACAAAFNVDEIPFVVNTHLHADRLSGTGVLRSAVTLSAISSAYETVEADLKVRDGQVLRAGQMELKFTSTPGHTSGCCCIHIPQLNCLFTGDTVLMDGFGRTDMQGGSTDALLKSAARLSSAFEDDTILLPAHEYTNPHRTVTLGDQKKTNPLWTGNARDVAQLVRKPPAYMAEFLDANEACGIVPDDELLRKLQTVRQSSSTCG